MVGRLVSLYLEGPISQNSEPSCVQCPGGDEKGRLPAGSSGGPHVDARSGVLQSELQLDYRNKATYTSIGGRAIEADSLRLPLARGHKIAWNSALRRNTGNRRWQFELGPTVRHLESRT